MVYNHHMILTMFFFYWVRWMAFAAHYVCSDQFAWAQGALYANFELLLSFTNQLPPTFERLVQVEEGSLPQAHTAPVVHSNQTIMWHGCYDNTNFRRGSPSVVPLVVDIGAGYSVVITIIIYCASWLSTSLCIMYMKALHFLHLKLANIHLCVVLIMSGRNIVFKELMDLTPVRRTIVHLQH